MLDPTPAMRRAWRDAARADVPRYPRDLDQLLSFLREREDPDPSAGLLCDQFTSEGNRCEQPVLGPWACSEHEGPDDETARQWTNTDDPYVRDRDTIRRAIWRLERARVEALDASDGNDLRGDAIRLKGKSQLIRRATRLVNKHIKADKRRSSHPSR